MKKAYLVILNIVSISIIIPSTRDGSQVYGKQKNNIEIIQRANRVEISLIKTIGGQEEQNEKYILNLSRDVSVDLNKNLYIVDNGDFAIKKYNNKFEYVSTIGRRGQGPGEFNYRPWYINIDNKGYMYVFLLQSSSYYFILKLESDGREVQRNRMAVFNPGVNKPRILNNNDKIIMPIHRFTEEMVKEAKEKGLDIEKEYPLLGIGIYDIPKISDSINPITPLKYIYIKGKNSDDPITVGINDTHFTIDKDDNIYVAFRYQNRIEKYSNEGSFQSTFKLNKKYEETNKAKTVDIIENGVKTGVRIIMNNFSKCIDVDNKGRIWILTENQPEEEKDYKDMSKLDEIRRKREEIIVLDRDGTELSVIPYTSFNSGQYFRIYNDKLYIINSTSERAVYIYQIVEK